ncbi:hypothetical protein JCM10212_005685 [Sporobolomyces blumeae]
MDFEPTVTPHPSYQLEDSTDDSDWDVDDSASRSAHQHASTSRLAPEPKVTLAGDVGKLPTGGQVVFLVGEAGERIAQGVEVDEAALVRVLVDGEQCGAMHGAGETTLVYLSTSIQLASLYPLASFLLSTLAPALSTIVASYHLPSYILPSSSNESPSAFSARLPLLTLSSTSPTSSSSSPFASLASSSLVEPYLPPNLLHGLPSTLLMLSSLLPNQPPTALLLVPTTTLPQPLNGPFSLSSPLTQTVGTTLYDAGGPVGLSDPGSIFRQLAIPPQAGRRGQPKLAEVKERLGWSWWKPQAGRTLPGNGFAWLERERKTRRKEQVSSMFM